MLPLIADYHPDRVFAWREGEPVSCGRALSAIRILARNLAADTPCINLCEERYCFTLAFAAVALAGGVNLLPHNRARDTLRVLRADYPDALTIDDDRVSDWLAAATVAEDAAHCPALAGNRDVAVVFTSGSTGRPGTHRKRWGDLVLGADLYRRRFFCSGERPNTVATVPPQHMYGLETSVLPVLQLGYAVDSGRPFMPWAVAESLARLPAPRLLVTTPVHLRACLDADVAMPALGRVISATAPLEAELAGSIESAWQTRVEEIFGSTETGSIASRRTIESDIWVLYQGMGLSRDDGVRVSGPQLPAPFRLSDNLDVLDARRFRLLGRSGDMLKIAGKRISVDALTSHVLAIDGVQDAVAFRPDDDSRSARPGALVVAPALSEREIVAQLAQVVDPVFIPRPLLRVDALPRNALGKIPRAQLLALLARARALRKDSLCDT